MSKITPDLLNDTLNLVQLARETALARGNKAQAERLAPVADNLRSLVTTARQPKPAQPSVGLMGQSDFQTLLAAVQSAPRLAAQPAAPTERNQIVTAMSAAGMADMDIARHLGLTREEVRLILNLSKANQSNLKVQK